MIQHRVGGRPGGDQLKVFRGLIQLSPSSFIRFDVAAGSCSISKSRSTSHHITSKYLTEEVCSYPCVDILESFIPNALCCDAIGQALR